MQVTMRAIGLRKPDAKVFLPVVNALNTFVTCREPVPFAKITATYLSNQQCLWCLRGASGDDAEFKIRQFSIWCVEQVEHLLSDRSKAILAAAKENAAGTLSLEKFVADYGYSGLVPEETASFEDNANHAANCLAMSFAPNAAYFVARHAEYASGKFLSVVRGDAMRAQRAAMVRFFD